MSTAKQPIRKSVSVPPVVAERIESLARARRTSENRVLVDLIETGLAAKDDERRHFLELVDRLARSNNKLEQERLKEELARLTFRD